MRANLLVAEFILLSLAQVVHSQTGADLTPDPPKTQAPIYFNLGYHQEGVGSICTIPPFPLYAQWRSEFLCELEELDRRGIVSDQYLSDYMVDVIRWHNDMDQIFTRFQQSRQNLGYHFHPASADVAIRTDRIRDLEFWAAVQAYPIWERAYYDWSGCLAPSTCILCGSLDPNRPGGIQVMEAAFGKPCVVENYTVGFAPVSLALQGQYPNLVAGVGGAVHTYLCSPALPYLWKNNWAYSPDPYLYVYKLMGLYHVRPHSMAHIEPSTPLPLIEQMLALLPRDRPHIVTVHGYSFPCGQTNTVLDYLQQFTADNPDSRFISAAELPDLVDTSRNARNYALSDLEEGARYLLRNWHGRPPAFIVTERRYLSLASFFKALQVVLSQYYSQHTWPAEVTVPDFVLPPLGDQGDLPSMTDGRTYQPIPVNNLKQVIQGLNANEIPYVLEVQPETGDPVKIHAAELLNGMCTLLLKHRAGQIFSQVCLLKGHIIPISNVPNECDCSRCCGTGEAPSTDGCVPCQSKSTYADSRLDWYSQLQLWTLEPVELKRPPGSP
ncbi:MAG: hypothetical protein JW955_06085 [Sedimentisphaerales bacterium]|nr:hypothetical protein [Sedimentisphaerales bacterium]